ncbi:MAG: hypothetical protein PHP75_01160 [Methylacidiphilaceae bacterium]|nr:hypothetical protein [Candidatus Methylacidiphilaceae bacterium]
MSCFISRRAFRISSSAWGRIAVRLGLAGAFFGTMFAELRPAAGQPVASPVLARPTPAQQRQIQQMQERLRKITREQDDELERLLGELHGASRDKKIDLLSRIVTRLIEQRKAFHEETEAVRLRILDMQNPPAPLPRATAPLPPPARAVEKPASSEPAETPPASSEQGYLPQQQ